MQKRACFRHPEKVTSRKCYECGRPICFQCTLKASHHFFCGRKCHWVYLLLKIPRRLQKKLNRRKKPQPVDPALLRWSMGLLIVVLVCLVAVIMKRLYTIESAFDTLVVNLREQPVKSTASSPVLMDSLRMQVSTRFTVTSPVNGAKIRKSTFSIVGEAPDNFVVILTQGERILRSIVPLRRSFRFRNVPAAVGRNEYVVRAISPDASIAIMEKLIVHVDNPELEYLTRDFTRGRVNEKVISLTFDGGSYDNAARPILEILDRYGITSTFFLTGQFMRRYPEMVMSILEREHEIGNHTWNHPHLTTFAENRRHQTLPGLTRERFQEQLRRTERIFTELTGRKLAGFWRAPFGEHNRAIRTWAAELGYRHIGWTSGRTWEMSMDTMDWVADRESPAYHAPAEIMAKIIRQAKADDGWGAAGGIILMHLGTQRNTEQMHEALPDMIENLRELGYRFIPISEMIRLTEQGTSE